MSSEQRRRRKDYDRDRDRDRDRDWEASSPRSRGKERLKSSQRLRVSSSKEKERDGIRNRDRERDREGDSGRQNSYSSSSSGSQPYSPRKSASSRPSVQERRTPSAILERTRSSQSYPSFSKEHSRESISKPDIGVRASSVPFTPEPTDLNGEKNSSPRNSRRKQTTTGAPPSPPLTTVEPNLRTAGSGGSLRTPKTRPTDEPENARRSLDTLNLPRDGVRFSASRLSLREAEEGRRSVNITPTSSGEKTEVIQPSATSGGIQRGDRSPFGNSPTRKPQFRNTSGKRPESAAVESTVDSDATPIPHDQKRNGVVPSPITHPDEHTQSESASLPGIERSAPPVNGRGPLLEVFASMGSESEFAELVPTFNILSPEADLHPPPPPPPPALEPVDIPRVDYLLQNGGLNHVIHRSFSKSAELMLQQRSMHPDSAVSLSAASLQSVFAPYHAVLGDLEKVLSVGGSVAVATGYRSVARRLLERLEAVFARNISNELCTCVMCHMDGQKHEPIPDRAGVSWGEILELVSGRKELPQWPPFNLPTSTTGLGISDLEHAAPMQNLDIDVPEEYREHYLRQSKKTKHAVQNWLASQPEDGPPAEVDDETLTFAMLTYLETDQRRIFTALSRGLGTLPPSRAPTPAYTEPKTDLIARIGVALQRLYRLNRPPREPESCMYLLKNPSLHSALATLAAISKPEWDILTSGRFDGFLWSGAEDFSQLPQASGATDGWPSTNSRAPSRGAPPLSGMAPPGNSRTTTPFSPGGVPLPRGATPFRTATPASTINTTLPPGVIQPGPVQLDEETEISMLAEVERDIFQGMEALEDALEQLHVKAEAVRDALINRSAGLAASARRRNGGDGGGANGGLLDDLSARLSTPVLNGRGAVLPGLGIPLNTSPTATRGFPPHLQQHPSPNDHLKYAPNPSPAPPTPDPDWTASGAFGFGFDDTMSLAPDDSASNVGWRERERRQRERERTGSGRDGSGRDSGLRGGVGSGTAFSSARGLSKRWTKRLRPEPVREEG